MADYPQTADVYEAPVTSSQNNKTKKKRSKSKKRYRFAIVATEIDKPFCFLVLVLLVLGIVMMFSASYARALSEIGDGYFYVRKQIFSAVLGLVAMFAISFVDYRFFCNKPIAYLAFFSTWALTFITIFVGSTTADATRWLNIGSFQLQPSELMKVGFIIMLAYALTVNFHKFHLWQRSIAPAAGVLGLVAGVLVGQRHMSAVLLVAAIGVTMMWVSGMPKKHFFIFIGIGAAVGVALILYKVFMAKDFGYITDRIQSWQDPLSDPTDTTLQTYNSLIAIGSGGIFGLGFGESRQKYLYLPESQNDFVFSIVCEELGFVGAVAVILLFVMFILRGFHIATHSKDRFGMLLATGITIQIGIQALLNIAVASNAFPNTGISLPFFSYGGTALLIQLAEMGILLSVSRQSNTNK